MHASSYKNMEQFVTRHCMHWSGRQAHVVDIGSQDVNGTYRPLFEKPPYAQRWQYLGVDLAAGKNVDIVLADPYCWRELDDNCADIVISGQALEHIEYFWLTIGEIARILRPNGRLCLIAPSSGPEHRYPVDCWRFYPDGLRAVARYAGLESIECYAQWEVDSHPDRDPTWQDCVLVACPAVAPAPSLGKVSHLSESSAAKLANDTKSWDRIAECALTSEMEGWQHEAAAPPLEEAETDEASAFKTAFPAPFLKGYQDGTLAYAYRGVSCLKSPIDLALYAKAIWDLKPATLIEIGSKAGGSALWFADILRSYGLQTQVYSIDLQPPQDIEDPCITFLKGDVNELAAVFLEHGLLQAPRPWLVTEDSAHTYQACSVALVQLVELMQTGDLLVMEDGILDDMGLSERYDGGPNRALQEFFSQHLDAFTVDRQLCDLFGKNATYAPNAWLWKT